MIIINSNTRQFSVPGSDLVFGVVADSDAERKHFQCPRYVGDGLDLASCFIRINYRNANGKEDFYLVDDMVIDGDNITFSWLLSPKVTEYRGQVKFVLCAVGPDLKLKWHTTQGTGQVMDGLEPDNSHVESQTADVVARLISMVEAQTSTVEKVGADQVTAIKASAKTAQDSAVTAIETAGKNTRDSIPADYTALSDAMRKTAPGIVCHADGEVITLNDASDNYLRGLRIFGKSTQDGTPTPENPVEIVSIENPVVTVAGKNLIPFPYTDGSLTKNGVEFSVLNDGSIQLSGTATDNTLFRIFSGSMPLCGTFTFSGVMNGEGEDSCYMQLYVDNVFQLPMYNGSQTYNVDKKVTAISLFVKGGKTVNTIVKPQLEVGSVVTDYEPYSGKVIRDNRTLCGIPVASGGNYTDENGQQWICDEVDFERGVYVQRVRVKAFDGTEGWVYESNNKYFMLTNSVLSGANIALSLSSHFYRGITSDSGVFFVGSAGVAFYHTSTSVSEWKEFLSEQTANGTPVKLLYALATKIETPLSETELAAYRALHTNKPNTTILNDSGAYMSVDYTADTKLYIDNKIKEALQ